MEITPDCVRRMEEDGFAILPDVLAPARVDAVLRALASAFGDPGREGAISTQEGTVYAARNVLTLWPGAADVWRAGALPEVLAAVLGTRT